MSPSLPPDHDILINKNNNKNSKSSSTNDKGNSTIEATKLDGKYHNENLTSQVKPRRTAGKGNDDDITVNDDHNTATTVLSQYLQSFLDPISDPERSALSKQKIRKNCCGKSRSIYCSECLQILIPHRKMPESIQNGYLNLPFHLDIILDDRRRSSTGIHVPILIRASEMCGVITNRTLIKESDVLDGILGPADIDRVSFSESSSRQKRTRGQISLIDLDRGDTVPHYLNNDEIMTRITEEPCGVINKKKTYILFPSPDSVPLSSVADNISSLVVLDCKWTRSSCIDIPQLCNLPRVHLDSSPEDSFFWRWHSAGKGMLSTLEAIYFAASVVAKYKKDFTAENKASLIDLMWLFGIQRAATCNTVERDRRPPPFSNAGKELQRNFRKRNN